MLRQFERVGNGTDLIFEMVSQWLDAHRVMHLCRPGQLNLLTLRAEELRCRCYFYGVDPEEWKKVAVSILWI